MNNLIKGKPIADKILLDVKKRVAKLKKKGITPKLAVVLVGDDKPSATYVRKKQQMAEKVGITFDLHKYKKNISQKKLIVELAKIQSDKNLSGHIVQLPIPEHLYTPQVLNSIAPELDVDCLTELNFGKLALGTQHITPPTAGAVMNIIEDQKIILAGKNVTIIGLGILVGKPLALMMINARASVTTCNTATKNLKQKCLNADIIISGVGKKNLIKGNMIKKGTLVIDAGVCFDKGKMYGDANISSILKAGGKVTPTPGGVGSITVANLLLNTVICAEEKNSK